MGTVAGGQFREGRTRGIRIYICTESRLYRETILSRVRLIRVLKCRKNVTVSVSGIRIALKLKLYSFKAYRKKKKILNNYIVACSAVFPTPIPGFSGADVRRKNGLRIEKKKKIKKYACTSR